MEEELTRLYRKNRDVEAFTPYYEAYADLIALTWGFHAKRVAQGKISLGQHRVSFHNGEPQYVKLEAVFNLYRTMGLGFATKTPLHTFQEAVHNSLTGSAIELLSPREGTCVFIEEAMRVLHEVKEAGDAIHKHHRLHPYKFILDGGVTTGVQMSSQAIAIFHGLASNPKYATVFASKSPAEFAVAASLAVSKIGMENLLNDRVRLCFGIHTKYDADFGLVDLSHATGLNQELLKDMGYRTSRGCPASLKPSKRCLDFLERQGFAQKTATPLEQMVREVDAYYQTTVLHWFGLLSPEDKQQLCSYELMILEGRILENK